MVDHRTFFLDDASLYDMMFPADLYLLYLEHLDPLPALFLTLESHFLRKFEQSSWCLLQINKTRFFVLLFRSTDVRTRLLSSAHVLLFLYPLVGNRDVRGHGDERHYRSKR